MTYQICRNLSIWIRRLKLGSLVSYLHESDIRLIHTQYDEAVIWIDRGANHPWWRHIRKAGYLPWLWDIQWVSPISHYCIIGGSNSFINFTRNCFTEFLLTRTYHIVLQSLANHTSDTRTVMHHHSISRSDSFINFTCKHPIVLRNFSLTRTYVCITVKSNRYTHRKLEQSFSDSTDMYWQPEVTLAFERWLGTCPQATTWTCILSFLPQLDFVT